MIKKNMKKYLKYLNIIRKKGYFKSFKSTTSKEKIKLIFSAIPYAINKHEIDKEKSNKTYLFFNKIKKENNIKNLKFYSIKHTLYSLVAIPLIFFKTMVATFILLITFFSFVPITEDITLSSIFHDYSDIKNDKYFIGETTKVDKPLVFDLKNHILNPINSFNNLIKDDNKKTLKEFKDIYLNEYQIKKEGETDIRIFEQYIGEKYHYYHLKEESKKALLILDNNLKTVHYNVTFNNAKVYEDFSKSIEKTNVHFFGESSINKITKEKNDYNFINLNFLKYNYGIFDYFNPYKKTSKNFELKKIELEGNTTKISYVNANFYNKDIANSNYVLGTDFQEKTNEFIFIFSLLLLLSFIEKKYGRKRFIQLNKDNEKHIMDEYKKIKNINNNDILLLENNIKNVTVKKSKVFKAIQI
jgi:hypothetical protein